jgi:hypothetical protein
MVRFVPDSALEGAGFEPSVLRKGDGFETPYEWAAERRDPFAPVVSPCKPAPPLVGLMPIASAIGPRHPSPNSVRPCFLSSGMRGLPSLFASRD